MKVHVHVERLVLEALAVDRDGRVLFEGAFGSELGRLIAAGGLSDSVVASGAWTSLPAPAVSAPPQDDESALGPAVARAVYRAIGR